MRIEVSGSQAMVTDLGSTNGVKVNGQRIPAKTPMPLRLGDVIDLIEFRLALRAFVPGGLPAVAERVRIAVQPQPGLAALWSRQAHQIPARQAGDQDWPRVR